LAIIAVLVFFCARSAVARAGDAGASTASEMEPYTESIGNTDVKFDMLPIAGGKFLMGSLDDEKGHKPDESPRHEVQLDPFWLGKCEVTWNEFEIFMFTLDIDRRKSLDLKPSENDLKADALARPTQPYTDMAFGMGKNGYPAISMTHYAARQYCRWLSAKTGHYYRLPTEAEWEYACRAGTATPYSFGADASQLGQYAWYFDNSNSAYKKVGQKKPNPWGLYDMHGNVAEWVLDQYVPNFYDQFKNKTAINPVAVTTKMYPHVVRGGSWDDDAQSLRSAARRGSSKDWKQQDPQLPQSVWYFTDAQFVGFRLARPLKEPTPEEKQKLWDAGLDAESAGGKSVWPTGELKHP
jgi:formylglycine-generating enzyme required for sulfatase activity